MGFPSLYLCCILLFSMPCLAQHAAEKKEVLDVVQQFFEALEKKDSLAWQKVFLKDAQNYWVVTKDETIMTGTQNPFPFESQMIETIKERMRPEGVIIQVHQNIATAWVPYDLWVDDKYSHCGVDVFTMLNTNDGWKIATLAFSMEKAGCETD